MTNNLKQKYQCIINTIGIQKVHELYHLLGTEKISISTLEKLIVKDKITGSLKGKKAHQPHRFRKRSKPHDHLSLPEKKSNSITINIQPFKNAFLPTRLVTRSNPIKPGW